MSHRFTLPYSTWSNGAFRRFRKELLRVFRSVASELQLGPEKLTVLLALVQNVLKNAPFPQLGHFYHLNSFTGSNPTAPISAFIRSSRPEDVKVMEIQREGSLNVSTLMFTLADLHPIVQQTVQSGRKPARKAMYGGTFPQFPKGDFYLCTKTF